MQNLVLIASAITGEKILMLSMAVSEMAKAKAFYAEKLGWSVTTDYGQGDHHWVALSLPGEGASLTLTTMHENMRPGTMKLYLATSDIEAAYNEFKVKGVKVNKAPLVHRSSIHEFLQGDSI